MKRLAILLWFVAGIAGAADIAVKACPNLTVISNTGTQLTIACSDPGVPPPPAPPVIPPPIYTTGCDGFGVSPMETQWPTSSNVNQALGYFGPTSALVIHFRSGGLGDKASFNLGNTSGPNYNVVVASLSPAQGCNVARQYPPAPPILFAVASQTPSIKMSVGTPTPGYSVTIQPNTDYWVTIVNRLPSAGSWPGVNTCPRADCGTGRRIDFNTN
jgi:hypothetical protein